MGLFDIDRIKKILLAVPECLEDLGRPVDLRYAAVLYRDLGDQYVTKRHDFTTDIQGFSSALQGIQARSGQDFQRAKEVGCVLLGWEYDFGVRG